MENLLTINGEQQRMEQAGNREEQREGNGDAGEREQEKMREERGRKQRKRVD